ncbi:CMRF35-like molecule 9 isoform X1 [Salarias fasciatus]|uniref:CMRF35-like molecule 9 isoform X1 n=1 Tax=Salarias fasciatus TaxID=181472 RepID=UPI0011767EE2|nr:CMRF35-like molecule 9 isoform X1 [Salarias fasciatus]
MKTSLKIIVFLISGNVFLFSVEGAKPRPANAECRSTPVNQTAYLGGSATIVCNYPSTEENKIKHFYKEAESNRPIVIESWQPLTRKGRFSLENSRDRGVYTVNITSLTRSDAGKYVCAVRNDEHTACLTEIHLQVLSWDDINPKKISGVTSKNAYINCSYTDKHAGNEKFLCKGENPANCTKLIHTTEHDRNVVEGRFDIRDSPRSKYFYVYIKNLTKSDSGTYWCGFEETLQHDSYTKIQLTVAENTKSVSSRGKDQGVETRDSGTDKDKKPRKKPRKLALVLVVGILLCISLLTITVIMLCRQRLTCKRDERPEQTTNPGPNTEGENGDHNYEEIVFESQPARPLPSVYATVNAPADLLPEKNTPPDVNTTQAADPPAPVSIVYSTVKIPEEQ